MRRWAMLGSLVGVTSAAVGGTLMVVALSGPSATVGASGQPVGTVWTQGKGQQAIPITGAPNLFTAIDSSPKLPIGAYTETTVVDLSAVAPGALVLCGMQSTATASGGSGVYGVVDNTGGSAPISGHCVMSGATTYTTAGKVSFWVTVYSGPVGSASIAGWSMTETKVASVTSTA